MSEEEGATPGALPSEVFLQSLTNEVNKADVYKMVAAQKHMLTRFEKTNEMLLNFNALSKARYETTQNDFRKHTALLVEMKKDLDVVFQRIRVMKGKLGKMYPEAFTACGDVYNVLEENEEEEEEEEESGSQDPVSPGRPSQNATGTHEIQTEIVNDQGQSFKIKTVQPSKAKKSDSNSEPENKTLETSKRPQPQGHSGSGKSRSQGPARPPGPKLPPTNQRQPPQGAGGPTNGQRLPPVGESQPNSEQNSATKPSRD